MRTRKGSNGLAVNAVAGSYVVVLGLNIAETMRNGLRGFAIQRTDHNENETYWLSGTKVFESVEPHPASGGQYSSLIHPFQSFQWADYSAKPGYSYTYKVVAMYGDPGALEQRTSVDVSVVTERTEGETHTIHFNRGSPATQEYARRFQNQRPSVKGQAAYDWLSRGLIESIIAFIRRATGGQFGLKGAFYEFQWPTVLDELRAAKLRGVHVHIVFDDIDNETGPHGDNEDAIARSQLESVTKPRTNGTLMHNKFLVLTENGSPRAVLFGSTNLTENGLFGHANARMWLRMSISQPSILRSTTSSRLIPRPRTAPIKPGLLVRRRRRRPTLWKAWRRCSLLVPIPTRSNGTASLPAAPSTRSS
jgi:hypothetical protein